jgi:tetratricopeptide (TPR) repeat protein
MLRNFLTLILIVTVLIANAAFDVNENCIKAHDAILRLQLDDAGKLLAYEKTVHPENHMALLLENYIIFLKAILSEEPKEISLMQTLGKKSIGIIEKTDKNQPFRRPAIAQIHLLMAYLDARSGNYLSPSFEIGKAYRLLDQNHIQFPDYRAGDPQMGLLHIIIGSIPSEYKWLPDFLRMEGSVNLGETEIAASLANKTSDKILAMMAPECLFLLSMVAVQIADEKTQQIQVLKLFNYSGLAEESKQSPLLLFARVMLLSKLGNNDEAISILSNRPHLPGQFPFSALDYYLGTAKLNRLDKDSNKTLIGFASSFKGKNLIKSAYQRLAWHYLLQGDKTKYKFYMERIIVCGDLITESDKKAYQDALSGDEPNICLLKSRLLFDGGYYQKALDQLSCFNPFDAITTPHDRLEFYYRKARILHMIERTDEALDYYTITLKQGSSSTYYFAANAALNIGEIYESRQQIEKARVYYEKCLSLRYSEYRTGIRMKALTRLNLLKKTIK